MRKVLVGLVAIVLLAIGACLAMNWYAARPWKAWQAFARVFVQPDGRIVDRTANARSTSEGQAYGLFFALVANDRQVFDAILAWARDNLAGGDLTGSLPAWLWGQGDDGTWGVIDANPASDADLWMAYSLMEAARLWDAPRYEEIGRAILWRVKAHEVIDTAAGPMLLPAPEGFALKPNGWRFNPSYLPEFQIRYFAMEDPSGPWSRVWGTYTDMLAQVTPAKVAPDWFEWYPEQGAQQDRKTAGIGSYDAIRVYLWAGMTPQPTLSPSTLDGYAELIRMRGLPPEQVQVTTRGIDGGSPLGFSAAALPYLHALNEDRLLEKQEKRLIENRIAGNDEGGAESGSLGDPAHYYDQVLALFGEGWVAGRFRFGDNGQLETRWEQSCCGVFSR